MNKVKTKHKCNKCGNEFSAKAGNYIRHIRVCDGSYQLQEKCKCCKYCKMAFSSDMSTSERANHTRWCKENPKRSEYKNKNVASMRAGITAESIEKQKEGIKLAWKNGKYKNASKKCNETKIKNGTINHSIETKEKLREKALKSNHRRLVRSIREYKKIDGTIIMLDSSWEEELAKRLDELEIEWIRPDPLPWIDEAGITHNYFPDFYLPKYNLYLDPKNPQAIKVQKKKLDCLLEQYNNIVIIETLEECKKFNV